MPSPLLDQRDHDLLAGIHGPAAARAMRLLVDMASATDAPHFIDISRAHIDSCLFHGRAGLDFAELLVAEGARVVVPATLNVSSLDLLHPRLYRGDAETAMLARRLMDAYIAMGCTPTWTCAPYQERDRPGFGEHIAWAESNAIVFANSVLGARTDRYGDFIDICAAITGRVPFAGLHRPERRRAEFLFDLRSLPVRLLASDAFYPVIGHLIGRESGALVPVLLGLPPGVDEDQLKSLGAAAASSGGVAMFHAVGITPEAATLEEALGGGEPVRSLAVDVDAIREARDQLTTDTSGPFQGVSLGTPHFSVHEFAELVRLLAGRHVHESIDLYVSTARSTLQDDAARSLVQSCTDSGATIVTDTCTYITPILRRQGGVIMTNSAKWAWYAPGNLGVDVAFGSLAECVESAVSGQLTRDESLWRA